jgi:hypothetical protein
MLSIMIADTHHRAAEKDRRAGTRDQKALWPTKSTATNPPPCQNQGILNLETQDLKMYQIAKLCVDESSKS